LEDLELARAALRDRAAAQRLLVRLGPRVQHTVRLLVGRDQEVEDLVHGCLLAILENLRRYRGTGTLEAWAGQLTYRVLMRQLKKKRRNERTVALVTEDLGTDFADPEKETARLGVKGRLAEHMAALSDKRREALVLRVAYGYSVAEVAEMMDVPANTVRDRIRTGLKDLRRSISRDPAARELFGRRTDGK